MKTKDTYWYDAQVRDIKRRKRKLCKSIPGDAYGSFYTDDDVAKNNAEVKKIKDELKKEKRAAKRAERKNWKDEAEDIVNNFNRESYDD